MNKVTRKWMGAGLLSAFAASLCCIAPLLALIAGTSSAAASFSWIEPLRPYLIGLTVLTLGFAWYQQLKPKAEEVDSCGCSTEQKKTSFMESKSFLAIISIFAIVMLSLPYYSDIFYTNSPQKAAVVDAANLSSTKINIVGMTCSGCENHVQQALFNQEGVVDAKASYENGDAIVKYDKTKVDLKTLSEAIEKETGYEVGEIEKMKH